MRKTNTPFLELPYNGAVLGKDGSASKNLSKHPRRFFFGQNSSTGFEACFFKISSPSQFLLSYSQAFYLALQDKRFGTFFPRIS